MSDTENEAQFAGPKEEADYWQACLCPCNSTDIDDQDKEEKDEELAELVEEEHEKPGVLWFSFFSDLIYVCVIIKFTEQYKYFVEDEEVHPESHPWHWFEVRLTLDLMLYFMAFFTIWLELVQVKARFYDIPGLLDDLIQFIFLTGIVFMAIQMDATSHLLDNKEGFVIGFTICVVSMFVLHLLFYASIESSRNYVYRRIIGYGCVISLLGALIAVQQFVDFDQDTMEWVTVITIIVCCFILLSIAMVSFRVTEEYNYTKEFFAMRFGILTMIIIGESMLACIIGDKAFGFIGGASASVTSTAAAVTNAVKKAASTVVTDVTLAPDAEITQNNVLQFLKYYETPDTSGTAAPNVASNVLQYEEESVGAGYAATGSYLLNKNGYYVYDGKGAFFQAGGASNIDDYVGIFLAFGTLYLLMQIYFGSHGQLAKEALDNARSPGSVWWIMMHIPMYFFLLTAGAGFRLTFTCIHEHSIYEGYVALLVMSVALAITFMLLIRFALPNNAFCNTRMLEMIFRISLVMILSALVLIFCNDSMLLLACVFGIACVSWIFDLVSPPITEDDHDPSEDEGEGCCSKSSCWGRFMSTCGCLEICGIEQYEYPSNFRGPKKEGYESDLLADILCCQLCTRPADIPAFFDDYGMGLMDSSSDHHGENVHNDEGSEHGMFGEFTDLIYVAVIIKFADQMKYKQMSPYQADNDLVDSAEGHARVYIEAAVFFMCFFYTWLELTHCLLRFKNLNGIFDDVMYFFYLAGVVGMAVNLNHLEYLTERKLAFCAWFAFTMASLAILHFFFRQIDDAESYTAKRIPVFAISAIIALVSGFCEPVICLFLLVIAVCIPLLVSVNSYRIWEGQRYFNKHDQMKYIERFGLLIMICIGESILALILIDFEKTFKNYLVVFVAFATMFALLQSYVLADASARSHALAEGEICGSICWVLMHGVAAFFLLGMGVGYKMIMPYAESSHVGDIERYTLCVSLFGVLTSFIAIRAAHKYFQINGISFVIRMCLAGSTIVAAYFVPKPLYIVGICCIIAFVSWSLDYAFAVPGGLEWEIDQEVKRKNAPTKGDVHEHLLHKRH